MLIEFSKRKSKTDAEYVRLIRDKHDKITEEIYHVARRYFKNSYQDSKYKTLNFTIRNELNEKNKCNSTSI